MKLTKKNIKINIRFPKKELRTAVSKPSYKLIKIKRITFFTNKGSLFKKGKISTVKDIYTSIILTAGTKTRFSSGNLAINTTKWHNLKEDMKICENCKRKEIENNNIRRKALNDINEVDHINFQTEIFLGLRLFSFFWVFGSRDIHRK